MRLLRPIVMAITRREWHGADRLPESGFIAVSNHICDADPLTLAHFLVDHGIYPRVLAKRGLFKVPIVAAALRGAGMIPVDRGRVNAAAALDEAAAAVAAGECVAIYPEGTHTFDPQMWPMTAKSGVGRLALTTRAPVVPIAQWGPQEFRPPHSRRFHLRALPFPARVRVGDPIDLSDLYGDTAPTLEAVTAATQRIMASITTELAILRDSAPPELPFDRRLGRPR